MLRKLGDGGVDLVGGGGCRILVSDNFSEIFRLAELAERPRPGREPRMRAKEVAVAAAALGAGREICEKRIDGYLGKRRARLL